MNDRTTMTTTILTGALALAMAAAADWTVTVDAETAIGPIKVMNAVNNGPVKSRSDQSCDNFDAYAALKIPFGRTHDASICNSYGAHHVVDISAVFPNFEAPVDDPASYDFTITDEYLGNMRAAGTEPYFRLGQAIEHWIKKYGVNPPKDYGKWARICEHIVRHYNEGWANGFKWNIRYWEIWNEPDGNAVRADGRQGPTWTGTAEQFMELYKVTSLHLRACFGDTIKIGGPAFCWWGAWEKQFLPFCAREKLPLDFYSWHCYSADAREPANAARRARRLLDDNGFTKTESHLNEWNYVKGWTHEWPYSLECESGRFQHKGAAFMAAVLIECQKAPVDMLMFYDARPGTAMNNLFASPSYRPLKGYYALFAWRRLRELGTQVRAEITGVDAKARAPLFACAARNKAGRGALFVARYTDDNNVVAPQRVVLNLPAGVAPDAVRCHVTDESALYTETPLIARGGAAFLRLAPCSFALIEW